MTTITPPDNISSLDAILAGISFECPWHDKFLPLYLASFQVGNNNFQFFFLIITLHFTNWGPNFAL